MTALEGPPAVSPEILRCFWDLSDADRETRWKGLQRLISSTVAAQQRFTPGDDPSHLSPLLSYCMSRLLRGLASANYHTRESSSVGCTLLLKHLTFIQCFDFLSLMHQHLPIKADGDDTGYREVIAARALAYSVCIKRGYHKDSVEAIIELVHGVLGLYPQPTVREICAVNLAEMMTDCDSDTVYSVFKNCPALLTLVQKPVEKATAEDLLVCLRLWDKVSRDVLEKCSILPLLPDASDTWLRGASEALFARSHFEKLTSALFETTSRHPQLHCIWEPILALLLCDVDKFGIQPVVQKIQNFWNLLLHPLAAASTRKLFLAMCLSVRLLPRLNACYLPYIVRGKYWEKLLSVLQNDTGPLGECASVCFDQVLLLAKQSAGDQPTWLHALLFCRLPQSPRFRSIKEELSKRISAECASEYATDLMHEFLKAGSTERCSGFEKEEILKDLRTLFRTQVLNRSTVQEIVQFLVVMGLFTFDKQQAKQHKQLKRFRRSPTEMTDGLRQQCMVCLIHVYPSLDSSLLTMTGLNETASLLGAVLKWHSLPGVRLAREITESELERLEVLKDLMEFLETLIQETTEDELKLKRARALYDLLSVIQLYSFGNPETVSSSVFEDLSQLVAMLFGTASGSQELPESDSMSDLSDIEDTDVELDEEEEEHYMDVLMTVMIELCARRTDPYSIKLMLKSVKSVFAVFSAELSFSAWIRLLSILTTPDDFDIEQETQPVSEDDTSDDASIPEIKSEVESVDAIKSEEEEVVSLDGSDTDLNELFDASALLEEKRQSKQTANLNKALDEDLSCASSRVLSLIEHVIKKHPKKDVTLLTPVYLIRSLLLREDAQNDNSLVQKQLQERIKRLLTSSLKCRPEISHQDLPLIQVELEAFLKEIPRKTAYRDAVLRVVSFLILRLIGGSCPSGCKEMAVELMKDAISQQFGRVPVVYGNTLAPLLSQNRILRQGALKHLVQCGQQSHRAPQKIKALEFINICLKDREDTALVALVETSGLGAFLIELLGIQVTGRLQLELVQELNKCLRLLQRLTQNLSELSMPFSQIRELLEKKSGNQMTAKLKRKWNQLVQTAEALS